MLKTGKSVALAILVAFCFFATPAFAATSLPFTVNLSEAVNVTGTPRIAIDVGGVTRYATYASGTGTSTLTFTYAAVAGDVDLDGITIIQDVPTSTYLIDLNGGSIKDLSGNNLTPLTFTPPATSNIKINYPSLGMDFTSGSTGRYTLNATVYNDLTSFLSATGGSFTRASVGTYFDSAGVLKTAASGVPRFDYHPTTHAAKGILMEETRTNTMLYSEQFDNAYWVKAGGAITANSIAAPDNTSTADFYGEDTTTGFHNMTATVSLSASTLRTVSVYAKASGRTWFRIQADDGSSGSANANFNLSTCTLGVTSGGGTFTSASSAQDVGNGWCRCQLTYSMATTTTRIILGGRTADGTGTSAYTGDGTSGIYLWGGQVETGTFPTSYIPTTTVAATRATDALSIPTGSWYSGTTGTITGQAQISTLTQTDFGATIFNLNDNTASNYIWGFIRVNGGGQTRGEMVTAASSIGSFLGSNSFTVNTPSTIGIAYQNANSAFSAKGGSLVTASAGTLPTLNKLNIGSRETGSTNRMNGNIATIKYYPLRVSNAQLQLLTQ